MALRLETYLKQRNLSVPVAVDRSDLRVKKLRVQAEAAGLYLPKRARKAEFLQVLTERDLWPAASRCTPRQQRRLRKRGLFFKHEAA